jgi:hypothetical protein
VGVRNLGADSPSRLPENGVYLRPVLPYTLLAQISQPH